MFGRQIPTGVKTAGLVKKMLRAYPSDNKWLKSRSTTPVIIPTPTTENHQTPPISQTNYFAESRKQIISSPFVRINDFPFGTTREDIVNVLNRFGVTPKRLSPHYIFSPFMRLLAWYAELNDSQQVRDLLDQWNNHPVKNEKFLSVLQIAEKDTVFLPNDGFHKKAVLFCGLPYDVEKKQIEKFVGHQFKDFHIEIELQDAQRDTPRQARAFVIMNSEEDAHRLLLFRHKKTFLSPIRDTTIRPSQITIYALMLE